jgi:hypothetical protein
VGCTRKIHDWSCSWWLSFGFFITNCLSNETVLIAAGAIDDSLQNKLSVLVENSSNFNWNYCYVLIALRTL